MIPMMVDVLCDMDTGRTEGQVREIVTEFVDRLTGKQTIYQMIRLTEIVEEWGGGKRDPKEYKRHYNDLLHEHIRERRDALRSGAAAPREMLVPGAVDLLENLRRRGIELYLASGTDLPDVREEARLLKVERYFGGRIYGALDDYESFSKAMIVQQIIEERKAGPGELIGFGDGYVEIEVVKAGGGVAVGVATDEAACLEVDAWKRDRLVSAGADIIIPNFLNQERLVSWLLEEA